MEFTIQEDSEQMHGTLTSVINRGGRLLGHFAGMMFSNQSPVPFAGTPVNIASERHENPAPGFWGRIGNRPGQ